MGMVVALIIVKTDQENIVLIFLAYDLNYQSYNDTLLGKTVEMNI